MDELHGPDFGGAAHRTGGEGGHQQVPDVAFGLQQSFHLADDMHHVGVALDHHQLRHLDTARLADPAQVVAAQVHQHHVFGPFLGIGQQIRLKGPVLAFVGTAGPGAGDRPQRGFDRDRAP